MQHIFAICTFKLVLSWCAYFSEKLLTAMSGNVLYTPALLNSFINTCLIIMLLLLSTRILHASNSIPSHGKQASQTIIYVFIGI